MTGPGSMSNRSAPRPPIGGAWACSGCASGRPSSAPPCRLPAGRGRGPRSRSPCRLRPRRSPMGQPKTILLVDDHNLFREGLKMIIRRDSGFTVVAEAKNADEGLRAALRVKPDLALLDISLPGRGGIDLARE